MLIKSNRISNSRLIEKLQRQGKIYKTSNFVFKYLPSDLPEAKFAVSVTKQIAPKAVDRNRLRRQTMESIRLNLSKLATPVVCLVILKKREPR